MGKRFFLRWASIVLMALALSAYRTVTVRADDGTPQATADPVATQAPEDGSAGTQAGSAQQAATANPVVTQPAASASTEIAAVDLQPSATAAPVDATAAAATQEAVTATEAATAATMDTSAAPETATATPEAVTATPADATAAAAAEAATPAPEDASAKAGAPLSQIPAGTDVVVLDTTGNPVDAGSPEAADIIAHGDPIWCPTGVAPKPLTGGCTDSFSLFNGGFITALNNKSMSGTIWISNTYTGEGSSVTLGGGLGTTVDFALTIQGGWNGITGSTGISGTSTFNAPLIISWNSDVTLNSLIITGVSNGTNPALTVTTLKTITLSHVQVNSNTAAGASLDNTASTTGSAVSVTNSQFNQNSGGTGLTVVSKGAITLQNVAANNNNAYGAHIQNSSAATPQSVTVTTTGTWPSNQFDTNGTEGLAVVSHGAITLANIDALDNGTTGGDLDNCAWNGSQCLGSGAVTLTGTNVFSENVGYGLHAYSNGAISANNLVNNYNKLWGAWIDNSQSTLPQPITLTGTLNQFNSNALGLGAYSKGAITINSVTANKNNGNAGKGNPSGIYLNNCTWDAVAKKCLGSGDVILTGTNVFDDNYFNGLEIISGGNITTNNVSANGNGLDGGNLSGAGGYGAFITNCEFESGSCLLTTTLAKNVTLNGINSFSSNYGFDGLDIESKGSITASSLTASSNTESGSFGAMLDNCQWDSAGKKCAGSGNVSVTGSNTFNNNDASGLDILSNGTIAANSLDAEGNASFGALITNCAFETGSCNLATTLAKTITLTGTNTFTLDSVSGLVLESKSAITGSNITANSNGVEGAVVWNQYTGASGGITLSGSNTFNVNGSDGVSVGSNGVITINNLTANSNVGYGAILDASVVGTPGGVTLTGANTFAGDATDGLHVLSVGAITVSNLDAEGNLGYGAYLDNCDYSLGPICGYATSQPVTLTGTNKFLYNHLDGLWVTSRGSIAASNIDAENNPGIGAYLDNQLAATAQPVTLTGASTFNTNHFGLQIFSKGTITVTNVTANTNDGGTMWAINGALLDNCLWTGINCAGSGDVILNGTNTFTNNYYTGLQVLSAGNITANNLAADSDGFADGVPADYGGYGVVLNNYKAAIAKNVTLTGASHINGNESDGLDIYSKGTIAINSLTANSNGNNGASLDNCYFVGSACTGTGGISLTGTNTFNQNNGNGLEATSHGAIAVSNLNASSNVNGTGASLSNKYTGATGGITITGTSILNSNNGHGLRADSNGAISVSGITANSNQGYGADLTNQYTGDTGGITLSGTNVLNGNSTGGVFAISNGAITANNMTANSELGGNGAYLSNMATGNTAGVTLTGANVFRNNPAYGLYVLSYGAIAVNNLDAENNSSLGAYLDNCGVSGGGCTSTLSNGVTLTGANTLKSNLEGTEIYSKGAISASNLTVNSNTSAGAVLDNSRATSAQPVTLSGTNAFNVNQNGLTIASKGAVTLNNVTASNNAYNGAKLDNCQQSGDACTGTGGVTLTGTNVFNANHYGLYITSKGTILLSNVSANFNIGGPSFNISGVSLDNCVWDAGVSKCLGSGDVTISGTNAITNNYQTGLQVTSSGNITASNLTAGANGYAGGVPANYGGNGAMLNNYDAPTAKNVTLTGTNYFTGNEYYGLQVVTKGTIMANSLAANSNGFKGASLDNCQYSSGACTGTGGITLTGSSSFNSNVANGLDAISHGAITASSLTADSNAGYGAYMNNQYTGATGGITISGTNTFNNNTGGFGLSVTSNGAISTNSLTASGNANSGARLANDVAGKTGAITLTGTNLFNGNAGDGLDALSNGAISASNLTASSNAGGGTYLYNQNAGATGGITVSGTNIFNGNINGNGLLAASNGAISTNNLTANGNGGASNGASLTNQAAGNTAGVTMTGTNIFNNDTGQGLEVDSNGAIAANNLTANGNGDRGAFLTNQVTGRSAGITLTGANTFTNNHGQGVRILSNGAISASSLTAGSNGDTGAYIDNCELSGSACTNTLSSNVTLTGANVFTGNTGSGVYVSSSGVISANSLDAEGNGEWGAYLDNCGFNGGACFGTIIKPITLTGVNTFKSNHSDGLWATSNGAISASSLTANANTDNGAYLVNKWGAGSSVGVTLTGSNTFLSNGLYGLNIISNGTTSLNSVTAGSNTSGGATITVAGIATPQNVTLTGTNTFQGNGNFVSHSGDGLVIDADGSITASNLTATGNGYSGFEGLSSSRAITLTGANVFSSNYRDGLNLSSAGSIVLNNVTANTNGGVGVHASTSGAAATITVQTGIMMSNVSYGWWFQSLVSTTLHGVFALGNNGGGTGNTNLTGGGTLIVFRT